MKRVECDLSLMANLYLSGKTMDDVSKEMGLSSGTVFRRLHRLGIQPREQYAYREKMRKYAINEDMFENINEPEKAYILGFLFADGSVNRKLSQVRLKLQARDVDILKAMLIYMKYDRPLLFGKKISGSNHQDTYSLIICNKKVKRDLMEHGLMPCKSFTNQVPELESYLYSHFIRGYFDGNGSIYVCQNAGKVYVEIKIIASSLFCIQLKKILNSVGVDSYIDHDGRVRLGIDQLRIRKLADIKAFGSFIYKDNNMCLQRKFDRFIKIQYRDNI